jgi:hypothetical protein
MIVDWEATGGRGILLVEAVSASWGSVPVGGGKQVWSEFVVPPGEPHGADAGPPVGQARAAVAVDSTSRRPQGRTAGPEA